MNGVKQFCRDNICLDRVTNPIVSLVTQGSAREKVQAAVGCAGLVVAVVCLVLGIASLSAGALVGGFALGLGVVALLLGIVLFCMATWEVLERHGLDCPIKCSSSNPELRVQFTKGTNGQEDKASIIE